MRNFRNNRRRYKNNFERNLKNNSSEQNLNSSLGNVSDFRKKNFSRNNFNSSKLVQKYTDMAREALSTGDKILYENYLQHAEHFIRLTDNNLNSGNGSTNSLKEVNINKITKENSDKKEQHKIEEN